MRKIGKEGMDKEELFQEYANKYKDYLYGNCSYDDVYAVLEEINSLERTIAELNNSVSIKWIIEANIERVNEIEKEIKEKYRKEIVIPLSKELLDFLQFEGLAKGKQYKKRAEELKEKLQRYDGLFMVRKRALEEFYHTKIGSKYDEDMRIELALKLGALDTKNL